jgi:hypothetical protein
MTITVPAEVAFDAFVDLRQRKSWLTGGGNDEGCVEAAAERPQEVLES